MGRHERAMHTVRVTGAMGKQSRVRGMEFGSGCLYGERKGGLSVGVSFKETPPKKRAIHVRMLGRKKQLRSSLHANPQSLRWRLPGTRETGEETSLAGEQLVAGWARRSRALAGPGCGVGRLY